MKGLSITLLFLALVLKLYPQWYQQQNIPTNEHLTGVVFHNSLQGWIACSNGQVLHTSDGGQSWNEVYRIGDDYLFSDMYFADESNGWLSGTCILYGIHMEEVHKKFIWYTHNGGQGWNPGYESDGLSGISVCFSSLQKGWAVSQGGLFLGSLDGGENWTPVYYPPYVFLNDLTFSDSLTGWATGSDGTVMKTNNNGALFNSQGIVIKTLPYRAVNNGYQTIKITLEELPPGLYMLELRAEGLGPGISGKFVKL